MDNTTLNTFSDRNKGVSAKDFFLHLGAIVSLYVVVGSFITLIFRIIGRAFPDMITNAYYWSYGSEISMPVATLIIVFPIFILLSFFVYKSYEENPDKKHLGIRKWLTYITLFVAGIILAGDLVTVLYKFLDGQDLTASFILKAITILLVTGSVFGFYMQDIREKISNKARKIWTFGVSIILLLSIILGFSVLGTPKNQRMLRVDHDTIIELQNLESQIINYWQVNGMIPESMPNLPQGIQYKKVGNLNFELCANFNRSNFPNNRNGVGMPQERTAKAIMWGREDWSHNAGYHCFQREIDQIAYPTQVRG